MGHVAVSQGTWSDVQLCLLKLALVWKKQRSGLGKKDIESPSHLRLKLLGSPGSRLLQNHLPSPRHLGRRNQHRLGRSPVQLELNPVSVVTSEVRKDPILKRLKPSHAVTLVSRKST